MTIKHREISGSQDGVLTRDRQDTTSLNYIVSGTRDVAALRAYMFPVIPNVFDGLLLDKVSWEQIEADKFSWTSDYAYQIPTDEFEFSFDTSGGQLRLTNSLKTTKFPRSTAVAPEFKGAIAVSDGKPEGVDITLPAMKFSISYTQPSAVITMAYVKTLARITGKTNDATFYGHAAGEVLFMGASGRQGYAAGVLKDPTIEYQFVASENATGLTFGDIVGVAKKGHEFLWAYYEQEEDAAADTLVPQPIAIYVEQVYRDTDFSVLGIGT